MGTYHAYIDYTNQYKTRKFTHISYLLMEWIEAIIDRPHTCSSKTLSVELVDVVDRIGKEALNESLLDLERRETRFRFATDTTFSSSGVQFRDGLLNDKHKHIVCNRYLLVNT